jgi:hypothetical protein
MGVEDQALLLLLLLLVGLGDSLYYLLQQILQSRHLGVQMRKRLDPQDSLTTHETGKSNALCSSMGSLPCPLGVAFQQQNLPGRIFSSCHSGM